jgi:minor extracellular serine protease Vpr
LNRRIWLPLVLVVAAAVTVTAGLAGAASGGTVSGLRGHVTLPASLKGMQVTQAPLGASNKMVGYILELPAKPVAVVDASSKAAGDGPLGMTQRSSLIQQLRTAQSPVAQAVKNAGGHVTAKFQTVYNGIGVRIPARDAFKLAQIQGVKAIYAMRTFKPANVNSVPLIGGPETWGGVPGYTGTGMKIGDIDTGLDYTHADFGGPGSVDEWNYALANSTTDPTNNTEYCSTDGGSTPCFGPNAPKVKGGTDLVGNCYDASSGTPYNANGIDCATEDGITPATTPQPDPNPLDCNSHGTHTAGTLAGYGVDGDGNTYSGPYNADTIGDNSWTVGPGVAPNASLYAIRVFGCSGSVDDATLIEAMDWAVNNGMDVINMSLGGNFGSASDADSVAASNTAKDGVIVVSASGNAGNAPYITSSPAAGTNGIAVAANDSNESFPAASLALTDSSDNPLGTITAIDANGYDFTAGPYNIKVIFNTPGDNTSGISLGCSDDADGGAGSLDGTNTIIVVKRGTCARVAKAIYGQDAGAVGVIMVNSSDSYPPFEGKITSNPDTGDPADVEIPFLGVPSSNGTTLISADGGSVDLEHTEDIANPTFLDLASFTSFGPSAGTFLKPEITGPGVSVDSAGMGTGNQALIDSGTSMATPHVAGEAALVKQAHPSWQNVQYYKDAILNTADPTLVADWSLRGAGAGEAAAYNATHTQVVAGGFPTGMASLNYQAPAMKTDYSNTKFIRLHNFGSSAATFNLNDDGDYSTGNDHTVSFSQFGSTISSVTVPAHGTASVAVTLSIPLSSATDPYDQFCDWNCYESSSFDDLGGMITLTPQTGDDNSGIGLTVPYYAVPTAASAVKARINLTKLQKNGTANALVSNTTGGAFGFADWFSLGATSPLAASDQGSADLLSAGVQSFPDEGQVEFALKVSKPWSNPAEDEFDVYVDVNGDGTPDYDVLGINFNALNSLAPTVAVTTVCPFDSDTEGDPGTYGHLVLSDCQVVNYAYGDFNGTTMELPISWDQLCMDGYPCIYDGDGTINYSVFSFDRNGGTDAIGSFDNTTNTLTPGADSFNVFNPAFSNGTAYEGGDVVGAGSALLDPLTIDPAAWAANPQEGFLVLMQNNRGHGNSDESRNIPFSFGGDTSHHHG